ncbi:hypothetical protein TREMEDRAFT_65029 [Tremella mesenterica DSM 1558]|uniref:uncharacterized protein n=1 Tax=Tremella mesenterica (strain ATCC 24925 / CBS 8224 / DSM 1558 / NBRC 9311 / NRRL Y-6157 / RJB 2259-6 / UBC 559-6) TaxID=578456 RepID=UPI00032BB998|nr:uncharacterized protein TREMEDRAFT_65029 [Tremella mesenterica DSM 1558]EIW66647.1 hypothetical protein TREMEDRAFT_65029 [Tremella mesenterica DSM 1558]
MPNQTILTAVLTCQLWTHLHDHFHNNILTISPYVWTTGGITITWAELVLALPDLSGMEWPPLRQIPNFLLFSGDNHGVQGGSCCRLKRHIKTLCLRLEAIHLIRTKATALGAVPIPARIVRTKHLLYQLWCLFVEEGHRGIQSFFYDLYIVVPDGDLERLPLYLEVRLNRFQLIW